MTELPGHPRTRRRGDRIVGPLIGHRGAAGVAPENTLASLRVASELGLAWVEFDVRLSRDGQAMLFHDDRLERTTDGRGSFADHDLRELKRLDAGSWFAPEYRGEAIPTLVEAVAALDFFGLAANIEIKPDAERETATARAVIETLQAVWPADLPVPVISSFKPRAMAVASAAAPDYEHALLLDAIPRDWERRLRAVGCTALHCSARRLTRKRAREVVGAGVPLRCYTVNAARTARRLLGWGAEAVFTDDPDRIARD